MIHLKRFNEEIGNPKLLDFHKDYKKLFDYDEDDYEEGDEPSRVDLFSMIGDLCVQHDMTQQEVRQVLDTFDCSFDVDELLEATYDNWTDEIGTSDSNSDEYVLITHHESGDEIHFSLVKYSLYNEIEGVIGNDPGKASHSDINSMLEKIHSQRVEHLMCQTYVLEDWPFSGYNIVKCINLPELGM